MSRPPARRRSMPARARPDVRNAALVGAARARAGALLPGLRSAAREAGAAVAPARLPAARAARCRRRVRGEGPALWFQDVRPLRSDLHRPVLFHDMPQAAAHTYPL